jgi:cytoskeletal protein CcmA (bactofilin family)
MKRIFTNIIFFLTVTQAIDTDGTIDGIEPRNIITLDQAQSIASVTTFKSLEVIKKLEVAGTIAGRQLNEFLPNPTLQEVKEVAAACSFKEVIVEGTVTIEDTLNGQQLETILADVVYETNDDSEVVITAPKTFTDLEVKGDISVISNFINDRSLDNILMTDRDQVATFDRLHGDIFFSNLKLFGLFDGINATELEHNSVRTFGDQFIETPLILSEGHRVGAGNADVKNTLNGISSSDLLFIDQPMTVPSAVFNELQVENLHINGDVNGPGVFSIVNITDLLKNYLSKTQKQKILVPVRIKSLATNGTFGATSINGIDFELFRKYMRGIKDFKSSVLSGDHRLDNLIVDGSVNLKSINGRYFNKIVENVVWLNRPNNIERSLKFLEDLRIDGSLTVQGTVNKKSFNSWTENWISTEESMTVLNSDKIFTGKVLIKESLQVESINSIKFDDLLTVKDVVQLPSLNVQGNVNAKKLIVDGEFNKQSVKILEDLYSYDPSTDTHVVATDVHFNTPAAVEYLNTQSLNRINLTAWMRNIIRMDESQVYITGEKIFASQLIAQQGFYADAFNDIRMNFLDRVVIARENDGIMTINGDLVFADIVQASLVGLKGNLYTRFISGCDPQEWIRSALPIDRGVLVNGEF